MELRELKDAYENERKKFAKAEENFYKTKLEIAKAMEKTCPKYYLIRTKVRAKWGNHAFGTYNPGTNVVLFSTKENAMSELITLPNQNQYEVVEYTTSKFGTESWINIDSRIFSLRYLPDETKYSIIN